ncbi:Transcription termination factor NusA [Syntrophomonas zehnderi OL-4]|uniref:Transcription termination/antitermination protein NusA n=1 Tax=Syntrophomonas zehnderi OL-4 TaxID=690567 RepID=A0A0E3W3A5_9FIRM|nr:transcription termination factor NusA [Syntrophomonas zehnderi]CFX67461.1 Transcription termination factor NusA [Syntrophomonas zehnderi OL-4]
MSNELMQALVELEKERGIPKEALIDAIRTALNTAYKKNYGTSQNVSVELNEITGEFQVYGQKRVVEEVKDKFQDILLEEALELDPDAKTDDIINIEITPSNFGRIAAQTAKQVVVQKLREAERSMIFEEFSEREGEVVTGVIQRIESKIVIINLGRTEGLMLPSDQIATERYEVGQRVKGYIYEVKNSSKGPSVFVSRSHPNFLKRLFELEVPEIYEGLVEIKSIAREAGARSKISVHSLDDKIDSVGACVGPRGIRVQNIVTELNGEKIDIIKYSKDPEKFIANALSPSKVVWVAVDEEEKKAQVVVPDYQLSLAIGKEGQNARLAAKLTGWKIDIKSESQMEEEQDQDGESS